MSNPFAIFKIKREERWLFVVALLVFASLNALLVCSHWEAYTKPLMHGGAWTLFTPRFQMSGYDNWSWLTITEGRVDYATNRHPLYLTFLYPMYWLNHWLMSWTGVNWSVLMMAVVVTLCAAYSAIFVYRLLREVLFLRRADSCLLVALLFSFGHVMVPAMVPDHFIISMMLLTLTAYIVGKKMQKGQLLTVWQENVLLFFTSGMALSNGAKTMLAALFANGKKIFNAKYIILGFALPLAVLFGIQRCQYHAVEVPLAEKNARVEKANEKKHSAKHKKAIAEHNKWRNAHDMKKAGTGLLSLMDFETPRLPVLVENCFGEAFVLHKDHALEDELVSRPFIVHYRHWWCYAINGIIVLLFAVGAWRGRRSRLMQMLLCWFAFDMLINMVLGFAVNEVYIMTAGWAFSVPVAMSFLLKTASRSRLIAMRGGLFALTAFLVVHNLSIVIGHLY